METKTLKIIDNAYHETTIVDNLEVLMLAKPTPMTPAPSREPIML